MTKFLKSVAIGALCLSFPIACSASTFVKFNWPIPGIVGVSETVLKKGKTAKIHYDLSWQKDEKEDQINLKYQNFEILELDGVDLSKKENQQTNQKVIDMMTAVESSMPTIIIGMNGEAKDVVGLDETIDRALELLPSKSPEELKSLKEFLKSPQMQNQIKQKSLEVWRLWVETWLNCAPEEGKEGSLDVEIPVGAATFLSKVKVKNLGESKEFPGCVKFVADGSFEGEEARKQFAEMMVQLASRVPQKEGVKPFSKDMVQEVSRATHLEVVINPKTAQPQTATAHSDIHLKINDKDRDSVEHHDYVFEWTKK